MLSAWWKPDSASSACDRCAKTFEFFRRRHHCRLCGNLFCHSCSNYTVPHKLLLQWLGRNTTTITTTTTTTTTTNNNNNNNSNNENKNRNSGKWQASQIPHRRARGSLAMLSGISRPPHRSNDDSSDRLPHTLQSGITTSTVRTGDEKSLLMPSFAPWASVTMHRLCAWCYDMLEGPLTSLTSRTALYSQNVRNNSTILSRNTSSVTKRSTAGDTTAQHPLPLRICGRERKVCVIMLQGSGSVENGESARLTAVLDMLEQLVDEHHTASSGRNVSSKETTASPGLSISSASDLSGSERITIGPSAGREETSARLRHRDERFAPTRVSGKHRRKLTLQLPLSFISEATPSGRSNHNSNNNNNSLNDPTAVVRTHIVGVIHRHGFDKALLLQHTIGTDAYILVLDSETVPSVESGVGGGSTTASTGLYAWGAFPDPQLSSRYDYSQPQSPQTSPLQGSGYVRSPSSKSMAMIRGVWSAVERYGGDTPISAVVDRVPGGDSWESVEEEMIYLGHGHPENNSCNDSSTNSRYSGLNPDGQSAMYVRCRREEDQPFVSAEKQAASIYRALLFVLGGVLRRDMMRQEE